MKMESETIEFKKTIAELDEAMNSISAILNKHHRGKLYFGVCDDGKPIRQDFNDKTIRKIVDKIKQRIDPKISPEIKSIDIENIRCIEVCFEGQEPIYFAKGRAYLREGTSNQCMTADQIKKRYNNHRNPLVYLSNGPGCGGHDRDGMKNICGHIKNTGGMAVLRVKISVLGLVADEVPVLSAGESRRYEKHYSLQYFTHTEIDSAYLIEYTDESGTRYEVRQSFDPIDYIPSKVISWKRDSIDILPM